MMGRVYLIGAGPGDLGLLTLKAVETLKLADTIVFDRLINPDILRFARKDASLIDVGKTPGGHLVPQEEINRRRLRKARRLPGSRAEIPLFSVGVGKKRCFCKQGEYPLK